MALPKFIKTPKNQKFDYKPRHWDPKKEDLEARLKLAQGDENSAEAVKSRLAGGFRRSFNAQPSARNQSARRSNILLFAIIVVLVFVAYLILMVYLPEIETFLN